MALNETNNSYACVPKISGNFSILLAIFVSPFHIILMRTLIVRFDLGAPRYKVLASLSISDFLQISISGLLVFVTRITQLRTDSSACQFIRKSLQFFAISTLISASGSIMFLSVERFIACIYCLRLYAILTDKRVRIILISIWTTAFVVGGLTLNPLVPNLTAVAIDRTTATVIVYCVTVLSSTLVLVVVQVRLFRVAAKKMKVSPHNAFGSKAEASDLRRRQVKLSLISSAIAGLYIICMLPASCLRLYSLISSTDSHTQGMSLVMTFTLANTVVDPFVYGLGMKDIRKGLMKDLRSIKQQIVRSVLD